MITADDIKHVAKLSRLEFSEPEIESFKGDLNDIVNYITTVQKIDTTSVEQTLNCINAETELRQDSPRQFFTQQQAVSNAPFKKAGAFSVPAIID